MRSPSCSSVESTQAGRGSGVSGLTCEVRTYGFPIARRKSLTLEVVERLLDAAAAELAVRPMLFFDLIEDPEVGSFWVPDRLWSVPMPECLARVQVLKYIFHTDENRIWDLSDPTERIAYYDLVLLHGFVDMLLDSVDGLLLIQAWPHMHLPDVEPVRPILRTQASEASAHSRWSVAGTHRRVGDLGSVRHEPISWGAGRCEDLRL